MQNSKSIAPFFIGQEVVAIVDQKDGAFKKGSTHIVKGLNQCPQCKDWYVDIGRVHGAFNLFWDNCVCGYRQLEKGVPVEWFKSTLFAPITPKFETIEYKEVLEKEKEFVGSN